MSFLPASARDLGLLSQRTKALVAPHICAVVGRINDEEGEHVATGFFVQMDGLVWAVTASHVVAEAVGQYGCTALRGPTSIQLVDAWHHSDPSLDLCAAVVPIALPDMSAIPRSQFMPSSGGAQDHHLFLQGFPQARGRFSALIGGVSATTLPFITYLHASASRVHQPSINFPIEWPASDPPMLDELGRPISLPPPFGMSGSPVWALGRDATSPTQPTLIGVATHWDQDGRALLVTRVEHVLTFLEEVARRRRAFGHWCRRGRPEGSPDVDWALATATTDFS